MSVVGSAIGPTVAGMYMQTHQSLLNAEEVIYGGRGIGDDYNGVCSFCNSRIDEFGYCACGGNLGVD